MKGDKLRNKKLQNYVKRDKLCTVDNLIKKKRIISQHRRQL